MWSFRKWILALPAIGAACFAAPPAHAQQTRAETKLTIMVFQGMQNLPILTAQSKDFFAKRGIELDVKLAPSSDEMRNGLAAGRYRLVHSGVDNSVHLVENQKVDSVIFMGGDHGFNYLLVQPQINSYDDIRGKTVGVDAGPTHSCSMPCSSRRGSTATTTSRSRAARLRGGWRR